jgi:NADH-quinone oxidoreductase subunit L
MLVVVSTVSFLVHIYSLGYMKDDPGFGRFFTFLSLFTFSMLGLVIATNLFQIYFFWELVGVSSYLLIGFYYEKPSAILASKKAFIVTRFADFFFLIGILVISYYTETFDFITLNGMNESALASAGAASFMGMSVLALGLTLAFIGGAGKSAMFPLHIWLPDAMEGPTPVSALIHAATMVAAGVYLVARAFPIFTADALTFIAIIGTITAFVAATIAVTQLDFKKVLAYSTVSQLGYMVMSLGVGGYTNGFFHLVTHAWFKAALFLASGSVIHAMHHAMVKMNDHHSDPQDITNMGGLRKTMPWTYATFLWVTITISGVPLTSGFLSKDGILGGTLAWAELAGGGWHWLVPLLGFAAAGLTAFYMFRLTIVAFHGKHKTELALHTHENKWPIVLPLVVLAFLSFWFIYSPNPIDASAGWFHQSIKQPTSVVPAKYQWDFLQIENHEAYEQITEGHEPATTEHGESETHTGHHYLNKFQEVSHHYHIPAMILSLLIAGGGILLAFLIYQFKIFNADKLAEQFKKLHKLSFNKWYFDEIYYSTVIAGTIGLGMLMAWFDNKIIDGMVNLTATITRFFGQATAWFDNVFIDGMVNLTANVTGFFGAVLRKTQTGRVQTYLILAVIGLFCIVYFLI